MINHQEQVKQPTNCHSSVYRIVASSRVIFTFTQLPYRHGQAATHFSATRRVRVTNSWVPEDYIQQYTDRQNICVIQPIQQVTQVKGFGGKKRG